MTSYLYYCKANGLTYRMEFVTPYHYGLLEKLIYSRTVKSTQVNAIEASLLPEKGNILIVLLLLCFLLMILHVYWAQL